MECENARDDMSYEEMIADLQKKLEEQEKEFIRKRTVNELTVKKFSDAVMASGILTKHPDLFSGIDITFPVTYEDLVPEAYVAEPDIEKCDIEAKAASDLFNKINAVIYQWNKRGFEVQERAEAVGA